jgi:hypothetical protein
VCDYSVGFNGEVEVGQRFLVPALKQFLAGKAIERVV